MRISDWSSDVCSSDLPQTDIERQALLAEINGLVSGSIEAAFDPRADQGVEVYEAASARWGWMAFVVAALVELGRASCRARVCQYVLISVVAVSFKKTSQI